jgi:Asp-tRNA(Asn)/Glu-tRNA(Gln) amidotransferase B subunit
MIRPAVSRTAFPKGDGRFTYRYRPARRVAETKAKIIAAHPQSVADYKAGKAAALQFLVGQGMKESKGSANPVILREMFLKLLN